MEYILDNFKFESDRNLTEEEIQEVVKLLLSFDWNASYIDDRFQYNKAIQRNNNIKLELENKYNITFFRRSNK